MTFRSWCCSLPKRGNANAEYEDGYASDPNTRRFAVSDGATESSFAAPWAQALVDQFIVQPVRDKDLQVWQAWLAPLQETWQADIAWEQLPWFATEKAREGAFSSLVGLEFFPPVEEPRQPLSLHWRAVAVGDSCLFHIRDGALLSAAFPIKQSKEFSNRPLLLSSNSARNTRLAKAIEVKDSMTDSSPAIIGDRFLLATDAMAEWFLRRHEDGGQPAKELAPMTDQGYFAEFAKWAAQQRTDGRMRNDDVTLMTVWCSADHHSAT